jgi:hypothetical protein
MLRAKAKTEAALPARLPKTWDELIDIGIPPVFHSLDNGAPFLR